MAEILLEVAGPRRPLACERRFKGLGKLANFGRAGVPGSLMAVEKRLVSSNVAATGSPNLEEKALRKFP
jgi:hypothetical protein